MPRKGPQPMGEQLSTLKERITSTMQAPFSKKRNVRFSDTVSEHSIPEKHEAAYINEMQQTKEAYFNFRKNHVPAYIDVYDKASKQGRFAKSPSSEELSSKHLDFKKAQQFYKGIVGKEGKEKAVSHLAKYLKNKDKHDKKSNKKPRTRQFSRFSRSQFFTSQDPRDQSLFEELETIVDRTIKRELCKRVCPSLYI